MPTPTVTVTVTAKPEPAPTVTVTVAPVAAPLADDRLAALRTISVRVTGVEEPQPGRWEIHTSIEDPGGGVSGSPGAVTAVEICEKAVEMGATSVVVHEADGSSWILYGHPSYGNTCTEV